jgi:hypothetical protein
VGGGTHPEPLARDHNTLEAFVAHSIRLDSMTAHRAYPFVVNQPVNGR